MCSVSCVGIKYKPVTWTQTRTVYSVSKSSNYFADFFFRMFWICQIMLVFIFCWKRLAFTGGWWQLDKAPSVLVCVEPGFPRLLHRARERRSETGHAGPHQSLLCHLARQANLQRSRWAQETYIYARKVHRNGQKQSYVVSKNVCKV